MNRPSNQTEVLSFRNGDRLATIVTDGSHHRSYELETCKELSSLYHAISYLESHGYQIDMDNFNGE